MYRLLLSCFCLYLLFVPISYAYVAVQNKTLFQHSKVHLQNEMLVDVMIMKISWGYFYPGSDMSSQMCGVSFTAVETGAIDNLQVARILPC